MPEIDVTEILSDPMVAGEGFSIIRREEVVNNYGESVLTPKTITKDARGNFLVGAISPTGDNSLIREDAYTTASKTIKVITVFRLRGPSNVGSKKYQPDIVVWHGNNYEVRVVEDYSSFGAGMIAADCMSIDYIEKAPT